MRYLFAVVALLISSVALAQPPHPDGENVIDRRLEQMTENLDLTEEQQEKIRGIMEEHRKAMKKQYQKSEKRMRGVLTEEQVEQMEEMHRQRRERFKQMMEKRREHQGSE